MFKLLVVEDEDNIREGIVETIELCSKIFKVFSACNGIEALNLIQNEKIDAMILDIKMPKLDGIELLKILSSKNIDIKTIILSGYDQFDYAKSALEYGAIDYILKPIKPSNITIMIEKLKEERANERNKET